MVPEAFRENVANQLKFTHLDDVETVCRLQAEVYKEKAEMCKSLRLVDLGAEALGIALSGLERYPVLERLGRKALPYRLRLSLNGVIALPAGSPAFSGAWRSSTASSARSSRCC